MRQFSRLLGYHLPIPSVVKELVGRERFELSRPKALVPKASVYTVPPPAYWSTDRDSNSVRVGLQATASTASAFSAELKSQREQYEHRLSRDDQYLLRERDKLSARFMQLVYPKIITK